ncbi:amidohydrolase family protein [Streptomyces sp. NPDC002680]|uniref:amidohydrolase family protein n=1 Tax=Streptomyces sp. NPDC002680 TaxID=3364659 RepID=UPI0036CE4186
MNSDDYIMISVDDHAIEPSDMFEGRLPRKFADKAPFVRRDANGHDCWVYEGQVLANFGLNAVAGRPKEEYGMEPNSFDDMRAGAFDVHERVKDMSANGVLASLNFPTFARFAGALFLTNAGKTPDQALAMVQAYNDWHLEDWAGQYPDRFIPCCITPLWDPELQAREVRRVAERGCHAVTFSSNPYKQELPSLHSSFWDPFWAACEETGTVVCMHLGSSSSAPMTAPDAPYSVQITGTAITLFDTASDLIWSDIFKKFPNLKISLSEGGIGWIPYFLERVDYTYRQHGAWTGADFGDRMPSDIFKSNIITCFIDDHFGVANLDTMNHDMITWECDYPHSDSTWPEAPERLAAHFGGVADDLIDKISHRNAMSLYSFDPFGIRPRERCTVGALRAEVTGHDVSTVSHERHRGPKATTYGDIVSTGYRSESAEAREVAKYNERRTSAESAR